MSTAESEQGRIGPVQIDGQVVYGFTLRMAWGLRLRVDTCDLIAGQRVRVSLPPRTSRPYYVHEVVWVDGSGWWVQLVEVMELGLRERAGPPIFG